MKPFHIMLFLAMAAAACTVPVQQSGSGEGSSQQQLPVPEGVAAPEDAEEPAPAEVQEEGAESGEHAATGVVVVRQELDFDFPYLGEEGAPVTVIEYGDFSSSQNSDANFYQVAALKRDFVVSNKARLVFKPYPLDEGGELAAQASLCMWEQGSKQFWRYRDVLFRFYLRLDEDSLINYANRVPNVDHGAFIDCLSSRKYEGVVQATIEEGRASAIVEAPTFIIGGRKLEGFVPYGDIKSALDSELEGRDVITGNLAAISGFAVRLPEAVLNVFS